MPVDEHTREQVDNAEKHTAYEYGVRVVERVNERMRHKADGTLLAEHLVNGGYRIAEEAAGEYTHYKCGDTAFEHQSEEILSSALGSRFLYRRQRKEYHYETVAHVCHHDAVEQYKEHGHDGVGVNAAVSRQAVHIGRHVQRLGKFVVAELYRNVGVLGLLRLLKLPCAVEVCQAIGKRLFLRGGEPSGQAQNAVRADKSRLGIRLCDLDVHAVKAELEVFPLRSVGAHLLFRSLLLLTAVGKLLFERRNVFRRRAFKGAETAEGKPCRAKHFECVVALLL